MPKVNVYLPDELAEAVKDAGVPVSAICQRALEQAVRQVTAIRETVLEELDLEEPSALLRQFTGRARTALTLGVEQARAAGAPGVGTEHLLGGLLAEGANMALLVMKAVEIEPGQVGRELARHPSTEGGSAGRLSGPAVNALEAAVSEMHALGHNYLGCEHLLLGLIAEPDGTAGQVLRALGAELRLTRRALAAALAGYLEMKSRVQENPDPATVLRRELQPLVERIERLEERVGID